MGNRTVILIDDNESWARFVEEWLRSRGFDVTVVHDALRATELIRSAPPDVVITDHFLANLDGGKLCHLAKSLSAKRRSRSATI